MLTILLLTITIGIVIVESAVIYGLIKQLPNTLYSVGMLIRDQSIEDFGLQHIVGGIPSVAGGRPQEGLLGNPFVQKILMMVMDKMQGNTGSASGSTPTQFKPGLGG